MKKRTASVDYLRIIKSVLTGDTARSEPDLSTRLAGVLEELGLHTVVDTGQGNRKRPDVLAYLQPYEADLVLPAELVIESKQPEELAGQPLADALTGPLWGDKAIPYIKSNLPRIRYFVLTTFVDFLVVPISSEIRAAFRGEVSDLLKDKALKRLVKTASVSLSLAELATEPSAAEPWLQWIKDHFGPDHLTPLPLSQSRNTLQVETPLELEQFAETLARVTAGTGQSTATPLGLTGLFAAVCDALPDSYDNLDAQTKQDLQIFTLAANPYTKIPEVQQMLRDDFYRWRDDFVAASVHSVISRLFTLKVIEDNYCVGRTDCLIESKYWVINSTDCDAHLDNLSGYVQGKIRALKDSGNQVVQHLAVFGAFFDWIWLHLDPAIFTSLFRLFIAHDFSKLDHDLLGRFFEVYSQAVNRSQRKALGQYYTPLPIVRFMWYLATVMIPNKTGNAPLTVLDPGMGSGTFLKEGASWLAKQHGDFWQRMVGFDISAQVMGIAQANVYMAVLRELTPAAAKKVSALRLYTTDSLDPRNGRFLNDIAPLFNDDVHRAFIERTVQVSANIKQKEHFCLIIGNPPYKNNSRITQSEVARRFPRLLQSSDDAAKAQHRNIRDDYAWFFAAADHYVQDSGEICFITSDSYTRKGSYQHFREEILRHYTVAALIRLGSRVFQDVSPRLGFCIIVLIKRKAPLGELSKAGNEIAIPFSDLSNLSEEADDSLLSTADDPRFVYLVDLVAKQKRLKFQQHLPRPDHGYSFIPVDEKGLVNQVLSKSVPVSAKTGERIFLKKWPGIITAFDEFFRAPTSEALEEKLSEFFAIALTKALKKAQRRAKIAEWAKKYDITEQADRLESLADQITTRKLQFDAGKIKHSSTGSIPNSARWYPPAEFHCFIYYEPALAIERNVNEGKEQGWGAMGQWREPESHTISPKLVFTTSTNPKSAYKAFVLHENWYVKVHGGTSQQYNYTGLSNPSEPTELSMKPNNLTGDGEKLYDLLSDWNTGADGLLYFIAAIYNSELAQRFIEEMTTRDLQIRVPSISQKVVVVTLIQHARRLQWLHRAMQRYTAGVEVPFNEMPVEINSSFWAELRIKKQTAGAKGYKTTEHYLLPADFLSRCTGTIEKEQAELDEAVYDLYGITP